MAARLPDEDLAPVEGATPPQTAPAPTNFGLAEAGQSLASAETVGYRADAIATRAQGQMDQRAAEPYAMAWAGQAGRDLATAAGDPNYNGQPGFAVAQGASAQKSADDYTAKFNAGQLPGQSGVPTSGQQAQLSRQIQEALTHHQEAAWGVENSHLATALEKTKNAAQESAAASIFAPVSNQLLALQTGLTDYHMAHPNDDIWGKFNEGADAVIQSGFADGTKNMDPAAAAALRPIYDSMVTRARLDASGKLGEHVVAFKQESLDNQSLQAANTLVASGINDPKTFVSMMTPGTGPLDQILNASGFTPEQRQEFRTRSTVQFLTGLKETDPDTAKSLLATPVFDQDLGGVKSELLGEINKAGPSPAVRGAAEAEVAKSLPLEVSSLSTTGKSSWTADYAASVEARVGGPNSEAWGKIQEERREGLATYNAGGAVPLGDKTIKQLQSQPVPSPGDPNYTPAAMEAAVASQKEAAAWLKDPVAQLLNNTPAAGKGGAPLAGAGAVGAQLRQDYAAWLTPGDVNGGASAAQKAAAASYVSMVTQAQANKGTIAGGTPAQLFSQAQRQALVRPILEAPDATAKAAAIRALQSTFAALPPDAALGNGTSLSAHGMFLKELMGAKLPPDIAAVLADTDGSPAGVNLLSDYVKYEATPGLEKRLPGANEQLVRNELASKGAGFLASNVTGVNQQLNGARVDAWYKMTRGLMAANPGVYDSAPVRAADEVMASVTGGYRIQNGVRMPLQASQALYDVKAPGKGDVALGTVVGLGGMFGGAGQIDGWTAAQRGMDNARSFAQSDNGAHLTPFDNPSQGGMALKDRQAFAAKQIAASGFWGNLGDNRVALMVHNGTDVTIVRDDKGRPFIQTFGGAIHAGTTGHGWWQDAAPPQAVLPTPGGRGVNHTPVPVGGAAMAGAVAAHGQQAMPADAPPFLPGPGGAPAPTAVDAKVQSLFGAGEPDAQAASLPPPNAPAQGAPASAQAPAAPGGGAPSAGDYARDTQATVPAAPGAQAPAPLAPQNELQRLLQSVGAGPAVTSIFAGSEYADPEAGPSAALPPTPGHPAPHEPFPPLNVSQEQAVKILGPAVISQESRGISGRVSPKGAMGLMQLMPDTVKEWAPRLGLPVDLERARTDDTYNVQIGTAILNHLAHDYMTGAVPGAGVALALAAYNAGSGRLEGYKDKTGYHQGWLTSIGDPRAGKMDVNEWVSRIPFKETREYVQAVLGMTTRRLAAVQGAGPVVKMGSAAPAPG